MKSNSPHYLLFSEANRDRCSLPTWRFVLQNVESRRRFAATDSEPCDCRERLELLAVVRGLEALDGPARVTLVTKSRYVSRGFKKGLAQWRENNWRWERFGRIVPVRDHDLWRRVDRALQFHEVSCQSWQFETPRFQAAIAPTDTDVANVPVVTGGNRFRLDPPHADQQHDNRGPRTARPVQRLKRRVRANASQISDTFRKAARPLREAIGAAT